MSSPLTSDRVGQVFKACLTDVVDTDTDSRTIKGIVSTAIFDVAQLEAHRAEILEMLAELPDPFHKESGGGWSFLQACEDRNGRLWTSLHRVMEQLVCLGMGIEAVSFTLPRDMWNILSGGMPYFVVDGAREEVVW